MEKNQQLKFKTRSGQILEANFIKIYIHKGIEYFYVKCNNKSRVITKKQVINETN